MIVGSFWTSDEADRAEALPVLTSVTFEDSAIGREVIIEGVIANNISPRYENLVAYERERRERDSDGDTRWVTEETVTPPLSIDTPNGRVRMEESRSSAYDIKNPPATINIGSNVRYNGFRANDAVMALGSVQQGSEGRILDAEFIYGGTTQGYVEDRRTTSTILFVIGIVLLVVMLVVIGAGIVRGM
jgi:hypothetical protein